MRFSAAGSNSLSLWNTGWMKSCRTSTRRAPKAEVTPGKRGTTTRGMWRSRASSTACSGPAPPKATSAKSRGSYPRATEITRVALIMCALASRMIPSAASSSDMPKTFATFASMARAARSLRRTISPPRKFSGSIRPRTRFASVFVGSVPPWS